MEAVRPTRFAPPRRPLALRDHPLIVIAGDLLTLWDVAPNAISLASIGCSALAAGAILATLAVHRAASIPLLIAAALGIGLRGLCNILDGVVAIEGGKATPSGALFNELPDRISDSLVLIALGVAGGAALPGNGLLAGAVAGLTAALFALATAYVRLLGASVLGTQSFAGAMAKQQRMLIVAAACLGGALVAPAGLFPIVALAATATIALGSAYTCASRLRDIAEKLG